MPSKNKKAKKIPKSNSAQVPVPENLLKIITDMCADLTLTFPEYASYWSKWHWDTLQSMEIEDKERTIQELFEYLLTVFPERFFDILYKNEDIFKIDSQIPTGFLPGVEFKTLYNCEGVSENTRNIMWNYLQLILFTILGSVQDKNRFGQSGNIFDGIDETELFSKLTDTMKNMTDFFQNMHSNQDETPETEENKPDSQEIPLPPQMPNIKELHEHLKGLFDGKIGALAKELAEEITGDLSSILGDDAQNVKSTQDVIKQLMKNPAKISELIKTIGNKIKTKISSGEVSQEELMKEATELLGKMKDMGGGMDQFKEMFKNMGVPMPKNARVDMNAVNRMTQNQSMRERLKKRMLAKKAAETASTVSYTPPGTMTTDDILKISQLYGLDLESNDGLTVGTNANVNKNKKKKKG
uniref:Uncharacterized protein n=1 Tax=viral metagenome TaxID=1070528 RepID=A0A6C0ICE6_9ZZZZ